ncbi:MAG: hypothetical protein V1746_03625 [bacterium]
MPPSEGGYSIGFNDGFNGEKASPLTEDPAYNSIEFRESYEKGHKEGIAARKNFPKERYIQQGREIGVKDGSRGMPMLDLVIDAQILKMTGEQSCPADVQEQIARNYREGYQEGFKNFYTERSASWMQGYRDGSQNGSAQQTYQPSSKEKDYIQGYTLGYVQGLVKAPNGEINSTFVFGFATGLNEAIAGQPYQKLGPGCDTDANMDAEYDQAHKIGYQYGLSIK